MYIVADYDLSKPFDHEIYKVLGILSKCGKGPLPNFTIVHKIIYAAHNGIAYNSAVSKELQKFKAQLDDILGDKEDDLSNIMLNFYIQWILMALVSEINIEAKS